MHTTLETTPPPSLKNILITGGAGFIGSHLVDALLAEGTWNVTVLDNFDHFYSPSSKRANLLPHKHNPNFRLYEADIRLPGSLRKVFTENAFSVIVHLAAKAGVRPSIDNPSDTMETNVTGTLNLLECAREFNVRQFIFGSSSSVYGVNAKIPFSESDNTAQPISPYAASKVSGEMLCHTYAHLHGIQAVCLRFFTVYGPRQRPDLAICKFARLITQGNPIPFFGDGRTRRDYTHVDDIVQGIRSAIDYRGSEFEVFNLGGSRTIELRELVRLLERALGRRALVKRLENQPGDVPITYADTEKSGLLLGYNPCVGIEEGIERYAEWFLKHNTLGGH